MVDIPENDIANSNVYISVLNPDRIISIPAFSYIKDTDDNTIIDVSLTTLTEITTDDPPIVSVHRKGRNKEKGYTTYLKATANDIIMHGIPNTIFGVSEDNATLTIKKGERLYFRNISTEGKIDFVSTGQIDTIARITEGDYYINDLQNKLEKGLDISLNYDGANFVFPNITQDTLIGIHTDDAVTHSIFDISMIKLTSTQNKLPFANYNNKSNLILTPVYLPNETNIYISSNEIAFNSNINHTDFNIYSVINNRKTTNQGKYTLTTQSGYYFAFGNKNKEDKIEYKSHENSLQEKRIITDAYNNTHEYLFIAGKIDLYVNDDFGSIDVYGFRQGSSTIIKTRGALMYGNISNFQINNVQNTSIQNSNIYTIKELLTYDPFFTLITAISNKQKQPFLYEIKDVMNNKKRLEIKYGTTGVGNSIFENEGIQILQLPETLISIQNTVNNNPIEVVLLPTSISYGISDISSLFATNTVDISLIIYNTGEKKYYLSSESQNNIKTNLSSLNTIGFSLASTDILEYFDIKPSNIVSLNTYTPIELQEIGIDVSYSITNNVDLSFDLGSNISFIIQENEFAGIDLSTVILPLSTTHISKNAFINNKLKTIDLSGLTDLVYISENAFDNNEIISVDFTNVVNLQKIHNGAFNRNKITTINLSNATSLTEIGDYAFYGSPITTLLLPSSIQKIGKYAFGFNKLSTLTLLGSINEINDGAFAFGTIEMLDISGLSLLTTIGNYAFANNDISENIDLPNNLTTIGVHAFSKNAIPKIGYNNELSQVGYGSFQENKLNNIDLSSTRISIIPQYAFYDNSYSKVMYLPSFAGFNKIGRSAFESCLIINEQIISSTVVEINKYAFLNNKISGLNLSNANGLQLLEEGIFKNNDMIGSTLVIPKNIESIEQEAFNNSGISQINFEKFKSIPNVYVEPALKRISRKAFHNNNITGILDLYSYNLEIIDILSFDTNQITHVNFNINNFNFRTSDEAFTNNPIETMKFPIIWRLKTVGFSAPFLQKTLLYPYTTLIDSNVGGYDADEIDTVLDGSDNIWLYDISNGIITVNDYTTSIEANVFQNRSDISGLILNDDLLQIKSFAFNDCSLNGKISLPKDIMFIGESAFENNNIIELDMSGSTQLATIGQQAFNFNNMIHLNFSGPMPNLTSVGNKSFGNNSSLETINFGEITNNTSLLASIDDTISVFAKTPNIQSGLFPFENEIDVNLPSIGFDVRFAQDKLRLTIDQLLKFGFNFGNGIHAVLDNINQLWLYNIDTSGVMSIIPGVISIANSIFKDNTNITKIIIPNSVTDIGDSVFENNTNLEILDITNATGLNKIGSNCFRNTSIKTLNLSAVLPTLEVDVNAFSDNSDLSFVDFTNITNSTRLNNTVDSEFPFANCPSLKKATIYSNDISLNLPLIGFPISFTQQDLLFPIIKLEEYGYTDIQIDKNIDNINNIWLYTLETQNTKIILTVQEGVKTVENNIFANVPINRLILPPTIETIGDSCFENTSMYELDMSTATNLSSIGYKCFNQNHFAQLDFSIPTPNILIFGNLSFANNASLTDVNFDDISENAILNTSGITSVFYNTPNFRNITIQDNVNMKKIGFSIDFAQERMLIKINDLLNNGYVIEEIDTNLTDEYDIWLYTLYNGELIIIDGVKSIEDNAFSGNNNINKIVFPTDNTLEYIGAGSFNKCNINTPLTIPSRVETIGNKAFYDNSISDLSFIHGNYLTTISGEAFSRNNYTKLIMRNYESLRVIGYECFANNADLQVVDFTSSSKDVKFGNDVFINDTGIISLIIPFYWNPNEMGLTDNDYDKVINVYDDFINDPYESRDTDRDGVGDNADVFPFNPAETTDVDRDGMGDNSDELIYNPLERYDINNDGMGDNITSYLETLHTQHSDKVAYDFRKYKTGRLPTQYMTIHGRNLALVSLDIITISNEVVEDVSVIVSVTNELSCVGKLQPYNINHHHSYKTYIKDRNKDYTQREFNFKSKQHNSSDVLLNGSTTVCNSTYKPSNKQYGIQGATTASNKIAKEKYNNITQTAITRKLENDKEIYLKNDNDNCKNKTIMNLGRVKRVVGCLDENN